MAAGVGDMVFVGVAVGGTNGTGVGDVVCSGTEVAIETGAEVVV